MAAAFPLLAAVVAALGVPAMPVLQRVGVGPAQFHPLRPQARGLRLRLPVLAHAGADRCDSGPRQLPLHPAGPINASPVVGHHHLVVRGPTSVALSAKPAQPPPVWHNAPLSDAARLRADGRVVHVPSATIVVDPGSPVHAGQAERGVDAGARQLPNGGPPGQLRRA